MMKADDKGTIKTCKMSKRRDNLLFFLSGENTELAVAEVEALLPLYFRRFTLSRICDKILMALLISDSNHLELEDVCQKLAGRLAFTREISRLLFECNCTALKKQMMSFDWKNVYKKDFCLRIKKIKPKIKKIESKASSERGFSETELADIVWRKLEQSSIKPKANLTGAATRINIHIYNKCFATLSIAVQKEDFQKRAPKNRPGFAPISTNPKLARCLVNLLSIKKGERILDPFCGTGGLLIEAGLIGCRVSGYDIDEKMLERCRKNLEHFRIKNFLLNKRDATKITKPFDYIISDLPYGRSSRLSEDADALYRKFFSNLHNILKKRAAIVVAKDKRLENIIRKSISKSIRINSSFDYYIHKSLTKRIIVMEKISNKPSNKKDRTNRRVQTIKKNN